MSTYRFEALMQPSSVAVVGASERAGSVGHAVVANLREGGFAGTLSLVNPRHSAIGGTNCYPDLVALPKPPDLAIVCAPPAAVSGIVETAAALRVPACLILTAGLGRGPDSAAWAIRDLGHSSGMRIVGPNCLGLMSPYGHLNASFASRQLKQGDLALISQSGAVAAGLIDWAAAHQLGFSGVVTLGDQIDVDFGDCLDHFAMDPRTRAILLYVEAIADPRKFMSAARAAARVKPIVVIKAGRHAPAAVAAATHTGALAGSDAVYDAAFRRAGLVRAYDVAELFAAAETLGRQRPFEGNRIAILTNGGGIGVLAVDRLIDLGSQLAVLSQETRDRLDAILPPSWSRANPVDIIGDADAERFARALDILLDDEANDAVLVLDVATRLTSQREAAETIARVVEQRRAHRLFAKPVFTAWIGADREEGPERFVAAGIPNFPTEADAVRGMTHLIAYRRAQSELTRMPDAMPQDFNPETETARAVIAGALAGRRSWLDPIETARVLNAYDIPTAAPRLASTPQEAASLGAEVLAEGYTVVLKVHSPDIVHKSDVDGVALDLTTAEAVGAAAETMLARIRSARPEAKISGFLVQPMIRRRNGRELIAGIADDPTFGPVVVFGRGGTAVEAIADKALALPPLDLDRARDLIARTRVSRVLASYRNVPAANLDAVAMTLVKLAQLAADCPQICELDLNPVLADPDGVIVVDARIRMMPAGDGREGDHPRMVIRPYPRHWERQTALRDGRKVRIRPLRPEDEALYPDFLASVTDDDLRRRFFALPGKPSHDFIARLTQLDYARAIAFAAISQEDGRLLGVSRLHADANHEHGEYAVLVRSDLKGQGLGWTLMELVIAWARQEGLSTIQGHVMRGNTTMLQMCQELGFGTQPDPNDPELVSVELHVQQVTAAV
ncbi:GNAT family N-acetyltransferase [Bosea sp. 62]|jgi:acetyltransferase|uniref:Bifunctional acetate--CoA ligase family protein/GNAT family N-acetyltransferase n=1 Tax=Bosea vestrisii TaxID=151416 RepID=A0ABW0HBA1_9HYPH|nr:MULTISPECIES: bifunctional acetate--CoA ligase family protein/GNAT family N-acetyltransferase [unclassified Bosea (in: a-proteobacteria)]CAD5294756.1 GNAT family N-acetyltransferase [Bosea sp. 21B]CAD5295245.1 GNAT family N-acetyltransferase [Bosea sp. 46]CAD5298543.1 GNAT family N-acetyltransferase [Bosea sp. 7B]VVT60913.1 Acetyltransferase [Bosea sp. EC-HK365B]VXB36685.1 GNAT family N-acetyltransferase [Bosea sp. 127]